MEPTPEEAAEGSILVKVLAAVLERLVNSNTSIARSDPGQVTKFHALKAPGIGVEAYLERVQKYASCSNECFILALIYIDRLIERNNFLLTELNVHRVVITAILLAAKFFDDAYYNNAYYAKVGGVLVSELNGLEVDFLFRINFSLHASPDVFQKYKAELVAHSINSGLIVAVAAHLSPVPSQQLPHISEMESSGLTNGSTNNNMMDIPDSAQEQHQHHQIQQQHPFLTNNTSTHTNSSIPRVTPSPSLSSQDISGTVNGNIGVGLIPNSSSIRPVIVQAQPQRMDQLLTTNNNIISAPFQPLHGSTTAPNSNKFYSQQQQQHHQSMLLQRANSFSHFSTGRCVDHGFKLPYSAPPMPATVPNVLAAVDQEQYQLMMNQLFPIESTLVHHNHHEVRAGTTATTNISNHQHHHVTAATAGGQYNNYHTAGANHHGLGSMAYQVGWTGEIR
ncbi:cyclin-domain-containing protein [Fragilariopsis cylindrus CCMP1102]|uniref:Cyclin-domain-containing protein n=1 Tax=Fragilariopsis cylindrus CCMP1102 TaxID=635003 RepID=A0A1E7EXN2_9STRA|nr:cyclin-domain-containing protein [Fragilariopsis cylindrus CCMP1102]|eukprot:OEU10606.1 cyclin-domain-containing protein [Fragilariopsis cylindrus CCMP1102]